MNAPALLTAATAIIVAALTYYFGKRRDREAEWRKLKLDHYQEFLSALSGIVGARAKEDVNQARVSDAINALSLVAPPAVLRALYAFHDEIRITNPSKSSAGHDATLNALMAAIRRDVHPAAPDDTGITFRLLDAPAVRR
jgi:hypothetical protein